MRKITLLLLFILFVFTRFSVLHAQSVGGTTTGATTFCSDINSGVVTLTGYTGTILYWQSSTDGGVTWNNNANTTPNQAYFNLAQTTCYRTIVQNGAFPVDTSSITCITIYLPSVGGSLSGGGTFCAGSGPGSINLAGYTGSILYWQSSTDGGATWNTISNTTPTESYTNITQNTLYWAVVQNGSMCPSDTSTQVSFVVDPATVAGTVSGAASVCSSGNAGTLTLGGNTGGVNEWLASTDGGASWTSIANTTASDNYLNLTQTTWYQVVVQSGSCPADTTPYIIVDVSTPSVAGTLSGGGTFCGSAASGTLSLTGYNGNIVSWASSTNYGASWTPIANTTATENYVSLPSDTWYTVIVQNGGCPADTANIEQVNVAPATVAGTISSSATVCYGLNSDTLQLSGNVGSVVSWYYSTNSGASWTPIANTSTSQPYAGLLQDTWLMAVVQSGSCAIDTTAPVVITVLAPSPVYAGMDTSITQGQSLTLSGTGTGTPLWIPSAGLSTPGSFTTVATPTATTSYILTVLDGNGCINADTVVVTVNSLTYNGMVSNLFTPNGDGVNDTWYIQDILNFPDNEVFVYNIYGQQVYTKKPYLNDWDGTYNGNDLPDGTYFYVLRFDNSDVIMKGSLDILRKK